MRDEWGCGSSGCFCLFALLYVPAGAIVGALGFPMALQAYARGHRPLAVGEIVVGFVLLLGLPMLVRGGVGRLQRWARKRRIGETPVPPGNGGRNSSSAPTRFDSPEAIIMSDCLFCRIAAKEIPADLVYEDQQAIAFRDIHPQAPTHVLIIPRRHVSGLDAAGEAEEALLGHLAQVAARLAEQEGLAESGYRVVLNNGPDAGQAVAHLHLHLLGGRKMTWPPG